MTRHAQIPDSRIAWPPGDSPSSSIVFAQNTIEIGATAAKLWALLIDCVRSPSGHKHCADVSVLRGGSVLSAKAKFRFKTIGFYFEPDVVTFSPLLGARTQRTLLTSHGEWLRALKALAEAR
jgi:hypothetical protein